MIDSNLKEAEIRLSLLTRMFEKSISGHTTRAPPAGFKFELATNGVQFYVIANLD